jgi:membrane associated rhomboid family serine protease
MNLLRVIFWTAGLAYCGSFLFAGRGVHSLHDASVSGAMTGAVLGLFFASMLTRRARRKHI